MVSRHSYVFSNAILAPVYPRPLLDLTSQPHRFPPARMHFTTLPQHPIGTPSPA
jgi:hypothetical protein